MAKAPPMYDPKCEDLARHFSPRASEALVQEIAATIQEAIESVLEDTGLCETCGQINHLRRWRYASHTTAECYMCELRMPVRVKKGISP